LLSFFLQKKRTERGLQKEKTHSEAETQNGHFKEEIRLSPDNCPQSQAGKVESSTVFTKLTHKPCQKRKAIPRKTEDGEEERNTVWKHGVLRLEKKDAPT